MDRPSFIERAFGLAYFIYPERETALRVVATSLARLEVTLAAQEKRRYYRLGGRRLTGYLEAVRFRNRISWDRLRLLQLLILRESEAHERRQERSVAEEVTETDLIVRFVKHLVMATVRRNSFYVAVGVSRVLFRFSTEEATDIFNAVIQDPDRYRDAPCFRRAKKRLLEEVCDRFGGLVSTRRGARGEKMLVDQEPEDEIWCLVRECLRAFMPWESRCVLPEIYHDAESVPALSFKGPNPDGEHAVEARRIHTLLHPECFARLTANMSPRSLQGRLAVPKFSIGPRSGKPPKLEDRQPVPLLDSELSLLGEWVEAAAQRRRELEPGRLSVRIDGVERATLEPRRPGSVRLRADDPEEVEIWGLGERGEELLAAYAITGLGVVGRREAFLRQPEYEVSFRVEAAGGARSSYLEVEVGFRPRFSLAKRWLAWREGIGVPPLPKLLIAPALLAVALALVVERGSYEAPADRPVGEPVVVEIPVPAERWQPTRGARARALAGEGETVVKIFVEPIEGPGGELLRAALVRSLAEEASLRLVEQRVEADAVLQVEPSPPAAEPMEEPRATAVVLRLVHREGDIRWRQILAGPPWQVAEEAAASLERSLGESSEAPLGGRSPE